MISALEWFWREGVLVLQWWALISLAGVAVLPLCFRLLHDLPDKGVLLARGLGLLLVGGTFWLLVNFGIFKNNAGGILLSWLMVFIGGAWLYSKGGQPVDWRRWWKNERLGILTGELIFLILIFSWAFLRAQIQDIASTEKPMDLMMLSATTNSLSFPANDAWLSGYAISYYYFGSVLGAILTKLSGVNHAIAYNLVAASWLALSGITIYGVAYSLVRFQSGNPAESARGRRRWPIPAVLSALLAVFLTLWLSNGQYAIVEVPHQSGVNSAAYYRFWDVKDRCQGPGAGSASSWWWFAAARSITDRAPGYSDDCDTGYHREVITEFPAFSFLLGDNHPHLLGIPFAALMMALALQRFLSRKPPNRYEIGLYGSCLAGQFCTNAWDAPIYFTLLFAAEGYRRWQSTIGQGWQRQDTTALLRYGFSLALISLIFAAPLWVTLQTQVRGLSPNLDYPTRVQQLFIVFAPFALVSLITLTMKPWRSLSTHGGLAFIFTISIIICLIVTVIALAMLTGQGNLSEVLSAFILRRSQTIYLLSIVSLIVVMFFLLLYLLKQRNSPISSGQFGALIALLGCLLVIFPEFIFIQDVFNIRMNTIFKFHYQAWLLFGLAATYTIQRGWSAGGPQRYASVAVLVCVGVLGAPYLPAGIITRLQANDIEYPSLDSRHSLMSTADIQLSNCLKQELAGANVVIAEAIPPGRRSYNPRYGRIATLSGLPTVIAWEGHQSQWRGPSYPHTVGNRAADIDELYRTENHFLIWETIERYGIQYILWGSEEQNIYGPLAEQKFADQMNVFCPQENDGLRVLAYATGYRPPQ